MSLVSLSSCRSGRPTDRKTFLPAPKVLVREKESMSRNTLRQRLLESLKGNGSASGRSPNRYQTIIAVLVLALAVLSLVAVQETNRLAIQNGQLVVQSSGLAQQSNDLTKIVKLEKAEVLADHVTIDWPATAQTVPLQLSCECFQYSGYLYVNWTSTGLVKFRVSQFHLLTDTESASHGQFRLPVSSADTFTAEFIESLCPSTGCGQVLYELVYHY